MSSLTIEVDGVQYGDFTDASCEIRLDALSRSFGFSTMSNKAARLPIRRGQACRIFADGELVLTGFVELINVSGDSRRHTIQIQGRDKTGDLLDSSLGSLAAISAPVTLKSMCQRVIRHLGTDIAVEDLARPEPFRTAEDIADPEPGDNAFEWLEQYARKRQVLLGSNASGDMVITTSIAEEIEASLVNRVDDPEGLNNVISYSFSDDSTGRFNLYRAISQLNPTAATLAGETDAMTVANQGDQQQAIDQEIRRGRQRVLISEAMTSSDPSKNRATWEANIRKARGRVYSCTVDGYRNATGDLWRINTLPTVVDDDAQINARMLINSVAYSVEPGRGSVTVLTFVERNAYTLELEEPVTVTEEVGDADF